MSGAAVTVTDVDAGPYARMASDGVHGLIADEPTAVGGAGLGPDPYALLLASLGACTSMTLRMYADRKRWPLQHVQVDLRHTRAHVSDSEACDAEPVLLDRIERRIRLDGALGDDQRRRLMEIADQCPVHRTLTGRVDIRTAAVEPQA